MDIQHMMEAGRTAERRGWADVAVIAVEELAGAGPVGDPVVAIAAEPLTAEQARTIAGLVGAGRLVALVTGTAAADDAAACLPPSVVTEHTAPPEPSQSAATANVGQASRVTAIEEPNLAGFPVLRDTPLGRVMAQAAAHQGITLQIPMEDPRCAISVWTTPAGNQCAIWVFGDPDSPCDYLVETVVGYDPDPDWVEGHVELAPMAVHLYHLLRQAERAKSADGLEASAATVGVDPAVADFMRMPYPPDPDITVDFARGSLWAVLGRPRVAVRTPDGTSEPPNMYPPPRQVDRVGYEVPATSDAPPFRAAMEQLIHLCDIYPHDPTVRRRLRRHGT